jgi:hypothetical protein
MEVEQLKPNVIVRGPIFSEPVHVIVVAPMGPGLFKLIGKGMNFGAVHEPILTYEQMATLETTHDREPFAVLLGLALSLGYVLGYRLLWRFF